MSNKFTQVSGCCLIYCDSDPSWENQSIFKRARSGDPDQKCMNSGRTDGFHGGSYREVGDSFDKAFKLVSDTKIKQTAPTYMWHRAEHLVPGCIDPQGILVAR